MMKLSYWLFAPVALWSLAISFVLAEESFQEKTLEYCTQTSAHWSRATVERGLFLHISALPESKLQQRGRFYYLYLFPSQESAPKLFPDFLEKLQEWDAAIWQERTLRGTNGGSYDLAESVCLKDEKWLDVEQWKTTGLNGATISDQRCLTVEKDGEALDVVYGLPISYEGLKQTYMWRSKRLRLVTLQLRSLDDFSFRDWTISKSRISVDVPSSCDFTDALLEKAEFHGPFTCRQILSTKNYKEQTLEELQLWMKDSEIPGDWQFETWTIYDPVAGKVDFSCKPTRARSMNELTENDFVSVAAPKEEFYCSSRYRTGRLANVVFLPDTNDPEKNSMKGWDLSRQDLTNAKFRNLDLTDVDFTNSMITCCSFEGSQGLALEQLQSTWNWRVRRMDDVKLPPELREEVDRALAAEASGKDE